MAKTVCIDFDGVLHPYTKGWVGMAPDDEPPAEGTLDFLMMLKSRGYDIVVFSSRAENADGHFGIDRWLLRNGLGSFIKLITHEKVAAVAYIDDRAVSFRGDWLDCLEQVEQLAAHPSGPARVG